LAVYEVLVKACDTVIVHQSGASLAAGMAAEAMTFGEEFILLAATPTYPLAQYILV
jgi:hypothetical protein